MTILYKVFENGSLSFGRSCCCDFCFPDNDLLSSRHVVIEKGMIETEITMSGKNGGFIKNRFVGKNEKCWITYGDEIRLPGIDIMWLFPYIAVKSSTKYETKAYQINETEVTESMLGFVKYDEFIPALRGGIFIENTNIELEAPPRKQSEEKQSTFNAIIPSLTMALPMMIGISVTSFARKSSGSNVFMYFGLITSLTSGIIGSVMAYRNLHERKKLTELSERRRRVAYERYVKECEEKIRDSYNKTKNALKAMNPDICEAVCIRNERGRVFGYNEGELLLRLGTGMDVFGSEIVIPKDRFDVTYDDLKDLPGKLKSKYLYMKDVPICFDVKSKSPVGIICEEKQDMLELMRLIIISICSQVAPEELALYLVFTKNKEWLDNLIVAQFLPHMWGKKRRNTAYDINSAKEILLQAKEVNSNVVITDSYCEISGFIPENSCVFVITDDFYRLPKEISVIIQKDSRFCGYIELTKEKIVRKEVNFDSISNEEFISGVDFISSLVRKIERTDTKIPDKADYLDVLVNSSKGNNISGEMACEEIIEFWKNSDTRTEIKIPIGFSEGNEIQYLDLHEKGHGPHGLIAGMTGSGKSEILQTIILSLAILYSPEDVEFFLIDYKGGGMASLFNGIPHLAGTVSNLSGTMVRRAMVSIKSENERRQIMFNNAGVNNIYEYSELYKSGKLKEPMPHVFIIVDEFAELRREEPDFMKEIISVARVGRSLGVHLILATQKPTGTVDETILSNSRFRICLRLQDRQDSNEVIHTYDAADITIPGRGILQVGNNEIYSFFQGAYTMSSYNKNKEKVRVIPISDMGLDIIPKCTEDSSTTVIHELVNKIIKAGERYGISNNGKLWLTPLQNIIFIEANHLSEKAIIGIYDNPSKQTKGYVEYDFYNDGHFLVLGGISAGKTNIIEVLIANYVNRYSPDDISVFIIDYGSFRLKRYENSCIAGGYFSEDNEQDIEKLFILLEKELKGRKRKLLGQRYGPKMAVDGIPPLITVIDGIGSFREKTGGKYDQQLIELLKQGEAVGIYFIISSLSISTNELASKFFEHIKYVLTLSLSDKYKYQEALRVSSEKIIIHEETEGRGLYKLNGQVLEYQAFICKRFEEERDGVYIDSIIQNRNKLFGGRRSLQVPSIPQNPTLIDFIETLENRALALEEYDLPVGYKSNDGEVYIIQTQRHKSVIISGTPNSGKSNFIKIITEMGNSRGFRICVDSECSFENVYLEKGKCNIRFFVLDDSMSIKETVALKEITGNGALIIHFGGALDRQSMGDFSYVPYTKQSLVKGPGVANVEKKNEKDFYGEIIIPRCI